MQRLTPHLTFDSLSRNPAFSPPISPISIKACQLRPLVLLLYLYNSSSLFLLHRRKPGDRTIPPTRLQYPIGLASMPKRACDWCVYPFLSLSRLRLARDIADLTARLSALGETDLPKSPLARSLASSQPAFSPAQPAPVGSPLDRTTMPSLDALARSPPGIRLRVGSPILGPTRDRQMSFSLMNNSLFFESGMGSPPASLPTPLFSLPSSNAKPIQRSPPAPWSHEALSSSLAPKVARGFHIARSPPSSLPSRREVPSSPPPTSEKRSMWDRVRKETQFDNATEDSSWFCAACEANHEADDQAAIVIQPCGTQACAESLRMRLHNGGVARCPRCTGALAHRASDPYPSLSSLA